MLFIVTLLKYGESTHKDFHKTNKSRTLLLIFIPLSLAFLVGITVFSLYLIVRRRQISQRKERCDKNNEMTEAASVQTSMTPESDSSIELYNITQV